MGLLETNKRFFPFQIMARQANEHKDYKLWYYIDHSGMIQGPFSSEEMDAWYLYEYFEDDLQIAFRNKSNFKRCRFLLDLSGTLAFSNYLAITKNDQNGSPSSGTALLRTDQQMYLKAMKINAEL
jgi:hypothetical protein